MHVICSLCNQGCRNTHTFRMVEVWHGAWFLRVSGCYVILIDFKTLLQRPCAASEVVKLDSKNLEVLLFSCWVKSNSLRSHGLQHVRLPCFSLSPGVCSDSYPLSQWCHPTISSSVTPFWSCPQSFPASGSFPMSWLFASGSQSYLEL